MKRPLISIATPCWNSEKTIERTIKSVLSQNFKDYEYIIVDGGSSDGTLDIVRKYEPLFEGRMRWISEPDKGIYDAFNKGAKLSTGVFCWNVNSDDYIMPDALTIIASEIEKVRDIDNTVIVGAQNLVNYNEEIQETSYNTISFIGDLYKNDGMINHPATLVAKSVYEKYGYYDDRFKICGDMDWFHRIYPLNIHFLIINKPITNFSVGGISTNLKYKREAKDRWLFFTKKYGMGIKRLYHFVKWHKDVIWLYFHYRN